MKNVILIISLVLLVVVLSGCARTATEEKPKQISIFVQVENTGTYCVVYDKETKVMYAVSHYGSGSGVFTLLVNADGSPKLWGGFEGMKPIVITVDEHGKTSLTPDELQKIVDEAYQTGYADGSRSVVITTPLAYPTNIPQPHYLPTIVTCLSGE